MKKRFLSTLLSVAMVSALLTGCGTQEAATSTDTAAPADTAPAAKEEVKQETATTAEAAEERRSPLP